MRIALFGGTFDPLHWGHLLLAESARSSCRLDQVLFIPTGIPPHKSLPIASAKHRLQMVRLATASNPFFKISDWEIRQKRIVYSFETLAHFRQRWPRHQLCFIVGADMLRSIDLWKKGRALLDQYLFLVAERPGVSWSDLPAGLRRKTRRIEGPAIPLACHEIRAQVRKGKSIRYQVPHAVEKYIRKHRLYR